MTEAHLPGPETGGFRQGRSRISPDPVTDPDDGSYVTHQMIQSDEILGIQLPARRIARISPYTWDEPSTASLVAPAKGHETYGPNRPTRRSSCNNAWLLRRVPRSAGHAACPSRIPCQAATGSSTKSRQWETERTLFSSARATHLSAGEGQQRVALQPRVAAYLVVVGQTPGATQRCLNLGCSERIGNSRRTGSHSRGLSRGRMSGRPINRTLRGCRPAGTCQRTAPRRA